jgi:translation initiation factor IF-1
MPTNKKGGKHFKRHKKQSPNTNPKFITRAEGHLQFYASVIKSTGNRHFMVKFHRHDGQDLSHYDDANSMFEKEYRGGLRGNIRKGQWVSAGDLVLVSLHDFNLNDNAVNILKKYSYEESKYLKRQYNIITSQDKNNTHEDVVFEYNELPKKPTLSDKKDDGGSYMNDSFMPPDEDLEEENDNNVDVKVDNNKFDVYENLESK